MMPDRLVWGKNSHRFWQSVDCLFILNYVSFYYFIICFHRHFLGELEEVASSTSYQIPFEIETSYEQLQKKWPSRTSIIHEHSSMAKCLSDAPPGCAWSQSFPTLCFTTSPSMTFMLHPDNSYYYSLLFPYSLGFGLVYLLAVPSRMNFSTPSPSLYTAHIGMSHTIHSVL